MKQFAYVSAPSETEATKLLGESALAFAGGVDLLNLMKDFILQPDLLVNLKSIPDLDRIEGDPRKGVQIGANATLTEILEHPVLQEGYPALIQALENAATPQIRNMSTLGGNICSRPLCWYFRNESFECRKKGGPICYAEGGENEYHSIFGGKLCHSVHASSAAPPLIAYGARVRIVGPTGPREMELEDLYVLPDLANVRRETILEPNEIVTHIKLPPPSKHGSTYEVRQKEAHDRAAAMASVVLDLGANKTCRSARVCLGAVAPVPWRSKEAEAVLQNQLINEDSAGRAASQAVAQAKPMEKNAYKVTIAQTVVKRAILQAGGIPLPRRI